MLHKIVCSRVDLADVLDLSEQRVGVLTKTGVLTRGPHGYDLRAAVRSYVIFLRSKTGGLTAERARLVKAQASLAEIKLRARTGEFVDRRAVERAIFAMNRTTRDNLLNVPARESGILASFCGDQAKIFAHLTHAIHTALEELANATTV
jgi:hypothetical protein